MFVLQDTDDPKQANALDVRMTDSFCLTGDVPFALPTDNGTDKPVTAKQATNNPMEHVFRNVQAPKPSMQMVDVTIVPSTNTCMRINVPVKQVMVEVYQVDDVR